MFEFSYKKNKNKKLFEDFRNPELTNFETIQNYIPHYSIFFSLTDTNWNSINLNSPKCIKSIYEKNSENTYTIEINNGKSIKSFFKFAPIINPVKYLSGTYKKYDDNMLYSIPTLENVNNKEKDKIYKSMIRKNNNSYVDGFFSYLSNKLKQEYGFIHGQEFYGSFLGLKNNFHLNIIEDIDYLTEFDYFNDNIDKIYKLEGSLREVFGNYTRKNKDVIHITDMELYTDSSMNEIPPELDTIFDVSNNSDKTQILNLSDISDTNSELVFEYDLPKNKDNNSETSSNNSSNTSNTSNTSNSYTNSENDNNSENGSGSYTTGSSCSSISDENLNAIINKMPVQVICLENMVDTLDKYMDTYDVDDNEWRSILSQIIFILLTYQKCFDFTHNDLHTNNIMYTETDEEYIYYKFNKKFYKVPTYGKIWKIIDFGRAIYTFKGNQIISDSYHPNEDAATQFNFGIYYNKDKPIVKPNYAFDLCRLGCSLFDYFFDDIQEGKRADSALEKIIYKWCCDDNDVNVLYKNNNKERYEGFKLYKMITRTVTQHTPKNQLDNPFFNKYTCQRRHINKSCTLINIDNMENHT